MEQIELKASDSLKTFGLLVLLSLAGVLAVASGLQRGVALWVIFGAATVQAIIIGRSYLRLRSEELLIYALALVPVALAIVLALVLAPDLGAIR
jgi:hypothetical protein